MNNVIEVKKLTKKYGNFTAVNEVSFDVKKGEIFGLLGENGAGKTTTLEMIEGLRRPSSGTITVLGLNAHENMAKIKERIGVQLQSSAYFAFLTLTEILNLFGGFYKERHNAVELLKLVQLEDKAKSYVGALSGGQRQRFSIAASLVNNPEVVFLDEPTTGLDPVARRNLWQVVRAIKAQGKTIILTTHYLEEAEILCDRTAIMNSGNVIALDKTHKLIEKASFPYTIDFVSLSVPDKVITKLAADYSAERLPDKTGHFQIRLSKTNHLNDAINEIQSIRPERLEVRPASLEDVFIELTGHKIEEA